jgi:hypothetical protein
MTQQWRAARGRIVVPGTIGPDGDLYQGAGTSEALIELEDAERLADGRENGAPNPLPAKAKLQVRAYRLFHKRR